MADVTAVDTNAAMTAASRAADSVPETRTTGSPTAQTPHAVPAGPAHEEGEDTEAGTVPDAEPSGWLCSHCWPKNPETVTR